MYSMFLGPRLVKGRQIAKQWPLRNNSTESKNSQEEVEITQFRLVLEA
jgi:hypothetical protein